MHQIWSFEQIALGRAKHVDNNMHTHTQTFIHTHTQLIVFVVYIELSPLL